MRVLSWVQTRLHGAHCMKKKSESRAASDRAVAETSGEPRRYDDPQDGWPAAMLPIGTLGTGEDHRDELTLLMSTKEVTATAEEEDKRRHRTVKTSLNGGIVKQRSFRKLVSGVFSGFLPRPSFRGAVPEMRATEISWPLLHKGTHLKNSTSSQAVIKSDRTAQMPWRGNSAGEEQGSKWIRTDSEYIVLEI